MAVKLKNPGLEVMALAYPLQGYLKGRQEVILSMSYANLLSTVPSVADGLQVSDLGAAYAGPNNDSTHGPVTIPTSLRTSTILFGMPNVAAGDNAAVADSTPVAAYLAGVSGLSTCSWVAPRAGSFTALSTSLSGAAAGSSLIAGIYVNGTIVNALAVNTIAATGTEDYDTFAAGSYTFAAGDNITVQIRTGSAWTATTSDLATSVEVQYT